MVPVEISPFPAGKDFTLTFVDDTDGSTRANTEPVYRLLQEHGIRGAKTVWPLRARRTSAHRLDCELPLEDTGQAGSTLEDVDYLDFALGLRDQGFEVALHGVASGNSRRSEIEVGLARFARHFGTTPAINVFHERNIDNLYCGAGKLDSRFLRLLERIVDGSDYQGHVEGSPHFWGDIVKTTFRYVRLPFHTIAEVNTLRVNPSMPFHDPRRPFARSWFAASDGSDVVRFNRLLSPVNLGRLESQRGACIVYTHFAAGFFRNGRLDPGFTRTIEKIAGLKNAWLPTPSELLGRLEIFHAITLARLGLELRISNGSPWPANHFQILSPYEIRATDGQPDLIPAGLGRWELPTLEPGHTRSFVAERYVPVLSPERSPIITPNEHRRIEYFNYLGSIIGAVADRRHYHRLRRLQR